MANEPIEVDDIIVFQRICSNAVPSYTVRARVLQIPEKGKPGKYGKAYSERLHELFDLVQHNGLLYVKEFAMLTPVVRELTALEVALLRLEVHA